MKVSKAKSSAPAPPGFSYFLGMLGSLVYFVGLAHGFWAVVLAFLKALVWPAFLTYDLFKFLVR